MNEDHAKLGAFKTKRIYFYSYPSSMHFLRKKSVSIVNTKQPTFRHCFEYCDLNVYDTSFL